MSQKDSDGQSPVNLTRSLADAIRLALAPKLETKQMSELKVSVKIRCAAGTCQWLAESITVYPDRNITEQIETICGTVHTSVLNAMKESPPRPLGKMLGLDVILNVLPGTEEHWLILDLPNKITYWRRR